MIADQNILWSISIGDVPGIRGVLKIGLNPDIDTADVPETVWGQDGLYPWQDGDLTVEVVSNDPADIADSGTGAWTVTITGLDENWERKVVTESMNGTTAVPVSGTWRRINEIEVQTAGTGLSNAGLITVRLAGAGATQAIVLAGAGRSSMAVVTVPAGHGCAVLDMSGHITKGGASAEVTLALLSREAADVATSPWHQHAELGLSNSGSSNHGQGFKVPLIFGPKTDIEMRVTDATASNVGITSTVTMIFFELL